ncbi:hypothetical protein HELRODRAFT_174787 [Helobdella robusta]|uniref:ZP domain-containing protein n=1 Tax=Helobdella robusta TaxID=6412 RepID=T1F8H1_HELRO|nr:hypothetical protein HELRODRAFT_174787 [Helobdella robusta]ESO01241.1 hypothetical protein HELRODRAFT_174787 [Helobdella robusta]
MAITYYATVSFLLFLLLLHLHRLHHVRALSISAPSHYIIYSGNLVVTYSLDGYDDVILNNNNNNNNNNTNNDEDNNNNNNNNNSYSDNRKNKTIFDVIDEVNSVNGRNAIFSSSTTSSPLSSSSTTATTKSSSSTRTTSSSSTTASSSKSVKENQSNTYSSNAETMLILMRLKYNNINNNKNINNKKINNNIINNNIDNNKNITNKNNNINNNNKNINNKNNNNEIILQTRLPRNITSSELTISCGVVNKPGLYLLKIYTGNGNELAGSDVIEVTWPVIDLTLPVKSPALSGPVTLRNDGEMRGRRKNVCNCDVKNGCSLLKNALFNHQGYRFNGNKRNNNYNDNKIMTSLMAASDVMAVNFRQDVYRVSLDRNHVFPCEKSISVRFTSSSCRNSSDVIRAYNVNDTETLTFVAERKPAKTTGSSVTFECFKFSTSGHVASCFRYVSMTTSGSVVEHPIVCLAMTKEQSGLL